MFIAVLLTAARNSKQLKHLWTGEWIHSDITMRWNTIQQWKTAKYWHKQQHKQNFKLIVLNQRSLILKHTHTHTHTHIYIYIYTWRKWQPTPEFLLGKVHGQRSLAGYNLWGLKKLDRTEWVILIRCIHRSGDTFIMQFLDNVTFSRNPTNANNKIVSLFVEL